jgi:hypothetical protein
MKTGLNNVVRPTLFTVVNTIDPIQAQQYCSILLTSVNNVGRATLFNPVEQQAHNFYACSRSRDQRLPGSFLPSPRGKTLGTRLLATLGSQIILSTIGIP